MPALNSDLLIRPFEAQDQEAARSLILEGLGGHFGFIDESRNPDIDDIMAHYVFPGHVFIVIQVGNDLVGTGALVIDNECVGRIVRVSVCRRHRRKGIGRSIVKHLIEEARHRGIKQLAVETNNDWYDAIGLYVDCGFSEHGRDDVSVYLALNLDPL